MSRSQCLCGIAIALAVIFGPTSAAAEIEQNDTLSIRPFEYVPSLDTTPVEIQIRGVRWRVPRNFLETATLGRSSQVPGWSAVLRMVTTLSILKGATPETLRCFKTFQLVACPDGIIIFVPTQCKRGRVEPARYHRGRERSERRFFWPDQRKGADQPGPARRLRVLRRLVRELDCDRVWPDGI